MDITTVLLVVLLVFVLQNWRKTENALYQQQCYIELLGARKPNQGTTGRDRRPCALCPGKLKRSTGALKLLRALLGQ